MRKPNHSVRWLYRPVALSAGAIALTAVACSKNVMSDVTAPTPVVGLQAKALPANQPAFFEFQVEKAATRIQGSAVPKYPDMLKQAGVEGEVLAQYIVDETGTPMPGTLKVLKSTHELFLAAVKEAVPNIRFTPAEVGGRKVKQLVQQPFVFGLAGSRAFREIISTDTGGAGGKGPRVLAPTKVTPRP